jgi:dephospho-CoA kinase
LGGIASGKSAVARLLAGRGGTVLDADAIAQEVLRDPEVIKAVADAFGPGVLDESGSLSRPALADLVFDDPQARCRLEGLTHPAVRARILAGVAKARSSERRPIVLDVPLLLEDRSGEGLDSLCDCLVFVDSDPQERDRRARDDRGWKAGEVSRREATQVPLQEKRARAQYVIHNQGTLHELERRVREVLSDLNLPTS